MENTLENKARFFSLYWRQKVMRCKTFNATTGHGLSGLMKVDINSETIKENWFLELKPLTSISDEDAIEVAKIFGRVKGDSPNEYRKLINYFFGDGSLFDRFYLIPELPVYTSLEVIDCLRSKGYALPFVGASVEELINRGWVKLKGETK